MISFTELQYSLLKRICPREPAHMSGAVYQGKSKLKTLLGDQLISDLRGKVVADFGCGEGDEALELARSAAARVIGLDIRERLLERARQKAAAAGLNGRCEFVRETHEKVDAIISLDSFEHFSDPRAVFHLMHDLLKPGGFIAASFGPTWYHPLGGHLFSVFPWAHLIFSEATLIRWRADFRSDGATRFGEVEGGLNQMTIARFMQLVRQGPFHVEFIQLVPIRRLRFLHNRLTREFTTSIIRCKLVKTSQN